MDIKSVLKKENVGKEFYFQGHVYMVINVPSGPYGREEKYVLQERLGNQVERNHDLMDIVNGNFERM